MFQHIREFLITHPPIFDFTKKCFRRLFKPSDEQSFLRNIAASPQISSLIQVGANDGLRGDPIRELIVEFNLSATLVEPDPIAFISLKNAYSYLIKKGRSICFHNVCCVTNTNKENAEPISLYTLSSLARRELSESEQVILARKASTDPNRLISYLESEGYKDARKYVEPTNVNELTMDALFLEFGVPDLLVTDTEGLDWQLINQIDLTRHAPKVIFFEHGNPAPSFSNETKSYFELHGYTFKLFEHNSVFYKISIAS